ncbi:hypothetical protein ACIPUB_12870 [Paeniglutamicibacter sp. ORCA_105]|uniref:hypothetical protein n=1 Tax=Paeniglutamicibacter sp. ORCA_105 TaxID=3377336 RepID=UPI00389325C6
MSTAAVADLAAELGLEGTTRFAHAFTDLCPVRGERIQTPIRALISQAPQRVFSQFQPQNPAGPGLLVEDVPIQHVLRQAIGSGAMPTSFHGHLRRQDARGGYPGCVQAKFCFGPSQVSGSWMDSGVLRWREEALVDSPKAGVSFRRRSRFVAGVERRIQRADARNRFHP